ncbi:alpha/beta hydrolase fold domain-containing protein [Candidatus Seribacter sulfatis]|uniref:alpha/beta hydrolase fold domain-containing protein n=1 Tax=Candidatus Seribacter sulfatis TaxID=3381756 RepID=UPI00389991EF
MSKFFLTSLLYLLCSSLSFAQKIEPTYGQVSYGPHQDMTLNFWKVESKKPTPLLVHIHGGGWLGGKKNETANPNELKKGYSFASIDYRLAGVKLLPAAVHDAARAIQFLRTKAKEWNFDPNRIAVIGGSAGAASSLWLAYHDDMANPKSDDPVLRQSSRVCGAVAMGGQTTLDPFLLEKKIGLACIRHPMIWKTVGAESHEHLMKNWNQYKDLSLECSPLTHVTKHDPPVFLNYGKPAPIPVIKGDGIHHAGFGRLLKEKCQAVGIPCYLQVKDHEVPPINKDDFIKKIFSIDKK